MANPIPPKDQSLFRNRTSTTSHILIEDLLVPRLVLDRFTLWLDNDLARLEERFASFCTHRSRKTSLGR
jgi:hypothetical protein